MILIQCQTNTNPVLNKSEIQLNQTIMTKYKCNFYLNHVILRCIINECKGALPFRQALTLECLLISNSRDSSVGIALDYGLDDRDSKVRFPVGAGNFSLHHHVQNGSGAHPASYPMGTRGAFPGGKATGA
jgi:hypothetical protein